MKKNLFLLLGLFTFFALASCKKSDNKPSGLLDRDAKVSIHIVENSMRAEGENPKTIPLETLKEIDEMHFIGYNKTTYSGLGIGEENKDFDKLVIKLWGDYIIHNGAPKYTGFKDGELNEYFIRAKDVYFTNRDDSKIVAYIPNKVLQEAYIKVKAAYDAGNLEEVYKLFAEAYTAIPTTNEEYAALKEKGLH